MAKKAERKAREEEARRVSGVPVKAPTAVAPAAAPSAKDAKRALRAQRPTKTAEGGGAAT